MRLPTHGSLSIAIFAGYCAAMVGCAGLGAPESQLTSAPATKAHYDSVTITCRISPGAKGKQSQVTLASVTSPAPTTKTGLLSIKYPHPNGRNGYALAELVVAAPGASSQSHWLTGCRRAVRDHLPGLDYADGIEGAYALDVPLAEVEEILNQLSADGYFDSSAVSVQAPALAVEVNGAQSQKPWILEPELASLAGRVRREGKLVGHRQPLPAEFTAPTPVITPLVYLAPVEASADDVMRLPAPE